LTQEAVLIAALSGRGLAASARRAGYLPLVADAFGDSDTQEHALALCRVEDAARIGLRTRQLFAALATLEARVAHAPTGLVLGSGFEDRPKLVRALSRRYRIVGNGADAIARCKDPAALDTVLRAHAIPFPDTVSERPSDPAGWLQKRIGGSGGGHITQAGAGERSARCYYQRRLDGTPVSVLVLARGHRHAPQLIGFSRQWPVGTGPRPYRYGGAVGPDAPDAPAAAGAMHKAADDLCRVLGLVGLVSLDFLLVDGIPHLLEVNPRPGATLDIFDDADGALFRAHVAVSLNPDATPPLPAPDGTIRAAAILYADRGRLAAAPASWPDWTADRPAPGSRVPRYRPIATVLASGATAHAAFASCRHRLDELSEMLYAQAPNRERNDDAEVQRPGPERISARSQAR